MGGCIYFKSSHKCAILYEGPEHLWILASEEGRGKGRRSWTTPTMGTEGWLYYYFFFFLIFFYN